MDKQTARDALAYLRRHPEVLNPKKHPAASRIPLWMVLALCDEIGRLNVELDAYLAINESLHGEIQSLDEEILDLEDDLADAEHERDNPMPPTDWGT
jgi:hypothetical protein